MVGMLGPPRDPGLIQGKCFWVSPISLVGFQKKKKKELFPTLWPEPYPTIPTQSWFRPKTNQPRDGENGGCTELKRQTPLNLFKPCFHGKSQLLASFWLRGKSPHIKSSKPYRLLSSVWTGEMSFPPIQCIHITDDLLREWKSGNPSFKAPNPVPMLRFLYELCWTLVCQLLRMSSLAAYALFVRLLY